MITYEEAIKVFRYDPINGDVIWINPRFPKKIGRRAGSKDARGYIKIQFNRKCYYAHRLAWFLANERWPEKQIDHINGDTGDNRMENLRDADYKINGQNRKLSKNNNSGAPGVHWHKLRRRWHASIWDGKRQHYLGEFKDIDEAIHVRKCAEVEYGFHQNHGRT